jgi:hypothetical protein
VRAGEKGLRIFEVATRKAASAASLPRFPWSPTRCIAGAKHAAGFLA